MSNVKFLFWIEISISWTQVAGAIAFRPHKFLSRIEKVFCWRDHPFTFHFLFFSPLFHKQYNGLTWIGKSDYSYLYPTLVWLSNNRLHSGSFHGLALETFQKFLSMQGNKSLSVSPWRRLECWWVKIHCKQFNIL